MKNLPYIDVDYCAYGFPNKKPTRIWTNLKMNAEQPKLCAHKGEKHKINTER